MRHSSKLSKLLEDILIERGYVYIDSLLMNHADHWSCPNNTEDDTVKAGIKMQIKSVKTGKPIYRLDCNADELFSAYFVADYATIKAWLNEAKDKAEADLGPIEDTKDKYCSECGRLKS